MNKILYAIIILIGTSNIIQAQNLTDSTFSLSEVVISASKFEEKKSDVAQQVQVIKSKDIAFSNQLTAAELLSSSGNVTVQKSQLGGGSPMMRGVEANKIQLVVDGVRMNNAIYRGGHLQNAITLDNNALDRVELVYGPSSTVYGSDALGGVIHFHSKKPQLANDSGAYNVKTNVATGYQSAYRGGNAHVDFNVGSQRVASLTSVTTSKFGDLRMGGVRDSKYGSWGQRSFYVERINGTDVVTHNPNANIQQHTGYTQYDIMQKLLLKQNDVISHLLNIQYSTSTDIPRYDRLTEVDSKTGLPKSAEWYYGPQKRLLTSYALNLYSPNVVFDKSHITFAYQDIEESRHNRNFNSKNLNHRIEKVKVYSVNADFSKQIKNNELRYGAELYYNTVNSTANREDITTGVSIPLDTRYPDGGSTMYNTALYLTHAWEISPMLVLNDGMRVTYTNLHAKFNDKKFFPFPFNDVTQGSTALTGNVGLVFKPGADWRFTALASSGFRAPNVDDLAKVFESTAGRLLVPNTDLQPENTYNGELGISKIIAKRINIEAVGYYTLFKDAITPKPYKFNGQDSIVYNGTKSGVFALTNTAEAYLYGYSLNLSADITSYLALSAALNYTYGRIKTDTTDYPMDHIAPMYGKTGLTVHFEKFRGEIYTLFSAEKQSADYNLQGEDNQQYSFDTKKGNTPAWYTLNIKGLYQINKYLQMQAGVENIMDQYYRVFASGLSAPGRNILIGLRGTF